MSEQCFIGIYTDESQHEIICEVKTEDVGRERCQANASRIVRAVNCFDDLLAACKLALAKFEEYYPSRSGREPEAMLKLRTAIAKAEA